MLYYRSSSQPASGGHPIQTGRLRALTTVPLLAYPAGCIIRLNAAEAVIADIAGFALILLALFCVALVVPSYFQRIVGDEKQNLDEFEMDLRRRAYTAAYQGFSALTLIFVMYFGIAADAQEKLPWLWTPSNFDHWNAIFWGGFLYTVLLPTAWIAWFVGAPAQEEE